MRSPNPDDPNVQPTAAALNERAIELRSQGRLQAAIAIFRDAVRLYPDVAELHQNLAHALYEAGENDAAIASYRRSLRIEPDSIATHLALYELLQIAGDRVAALDHQRRGLEQQRLFSSLALHEARSILI